jgi:hypothetical protein
MGVISIDKYMKGIENITEEEIKKRYLSADEINTQGWDFDKLLSYLRKRSAFIDYICIVDYEKARKLFAKIINAFQMHNMDIDEKVSYIREYGTMRYVRTSDWEFSTMPLISDSNEDGILTCCLSESKNANKWGKETGSSKDKIIHDENRKVIWIKNDYRDPPYFLKFNNNIYAIDNNHKMLKIYKNINILTKNLTVNQNYDNLDDIIKEYNYEENKCEQIEIDLSDFFPVGFFYRGPKWTIEWKGLYPEGFNVYREITIQNKLVRIEIENLSYPHKGCVLLDLENSKIIEAKKYEA